MKENTQGDRFRRNTAPVSAFALHYEELAAVETEARVIERPFHRLESIRVASCAPDKTFETGRNLAFNDLTRAGWAVEDEHRKPKEARTRGNSACGL